MHPHHVKLGGFEPVDVLQLIRSENVGPITFFNLLSYYGTPQKALEAMPELAKRGGKKRPLKPCDRASAEAEIEQLNRFGATLLLFGDGNYPRLLTHCYDAPPMLACLGNAAMLNARDAIGVVGARNASANGCNFVKQMAAQLGAKGFHVASGLARGIDTAAHLGSLETGTIAVIAGGIDHIYPPENESLYKHIAERGAILAEAPFGTAPQARHFPARNRIIAGMSRGLLVAEASLKSGSLISAHNALDYGREVFAMPGSPLDPRSKGANDLIRNGAVLTESVDDILQNLKQEPTFSEPDQADFRAAPPAAADEKQLDAARQRVQAKLSPEPVLLDELLVQCEITPHILHQLLLELELAGRLIRHAGGRVSMLYDVD